MSENYFIIKFNNSAKSCNRHVTPHAPERLHIVEKRCD